MKKLNQEQAKLILSLEKGADIYAFGLAGDLREIQLDFPSYISIGRPMMYRGDGTDRMPYFGCIATKKGLAAAKRTLSIVEKERASA